MESLLDSYCTQVATNNFDELCKTLFRWLDQRCSLVILRKGFYLMNLFIICSNIITTKKIDVLNSLRFVSKSTNILTNPELLHDEIIQAISMPSTTTMMMMMDENKQQVRRINYEQQSSSNS